MALWPFRLRGSRKRSRSGAVLSEVENAPQRSVTGGAVAKRQQRTGTNNLNRRARTYSFSPDRQDAILVDRSSRSPEGAGENGLVPESSTELQDPLWERAPTLHHKRSNNNPARRKSSKRRKKDHDREAEIKAMSNFVPVRSSTDAVAGRRPTKPGHKRANTMGAGRPWENPASELSLTMAGSIHSSMSSEPEFLSYKVSALDALAPRPTLRFGQGPRQHSSRGDMRSGTQKPTLADREPIPEETIKAQKRINDLADDFCASELRELMERDARRRERQQQHERDRMERRLARRAEKQKKEEAKARNTGTPPPENLERGVLGREVGLGIDPPSTVVTSSRQRISPEPMTVVDNEPTIQSQEEQEEINKEPLEYFHEIDAAPNEAEVPIFNQEKPAPKPEDREKTYAQEVPISAVPPGLRLQTVLKSKKSKSGSTLNSDKEKASAIDDDSTTRKDSIASSKTNRLSLTSFLRWGRARRNSGGPSSFSNTSREEMAAAVAAAQAAAQLQADDAAGQQFTGNYMTSKPGSGGPKRTRSRFREDLPELPLTPPESRFQSPEAEPPLPIVTEHMAMDSAPTQQSSLRDDTPTSGHRSIDIPQPTGVSAERLYGTKSAEPLSMSLASIDSEGSWLSGRVNSQRMASFRDKNRSRRREHDPLVDSRSNSAQDDLTEDDYMSRLSPDLNTISSDARQSGEARRSSEILQNSEEDVIMEEDVKWGAVGAHPHLVSIHKHDRDTFQSREGLLNIDSEDEEKQVESPVSPVSPASLDADEKIDLQRARSVHVGRGHVRNFSAGSAKLLEIGPRSSIDSKSRSQERQSLETTSRAHIQA